MPMRKQKNTHKNNTHPRRPFWKYSITGVILIILFVFSFYLYKTHIKSNPCRSLQKDEHYAELKKFNKSELSHYNGVENEKTYLGYHCLIYDVTSGKSDYYAEGKGYHYLVGRDSTKQLEIFGGSIIQEKYPVVGILIQ
jgi:predicted heme/steroid binding protein